MHQIIFLVHRISTNGRWLKSYEPEKLFDAQGRILEEIREIAPTGDQRMAKNPITNGGIDPKPDELRLLFCQMCQYSWILVAISIVILLEDC